VEVGVAAVGRKVRAREGLSVEALDEARLCVADAGEAGGKPVQRHVLGARPPEEVGMADAGEADAALAERGRDLRGILLRVGVA
jgi:hypothetical protein